MKLIFTILLFILSQVLTAQVEINGVVQFNNVNDSLNNIYSLGTPDSLDQQVRVQEYVFQRSFDSEVTVVGNTLTINTNFEFPPYEKGMNIFVTIPVLSDTINTPSLLKINLNAAVPIKTINNTVVDNKLMKKNTVLILIYDTTDFIVLNQPVYKCPGGFKKMNDKYCIQITRNAMATFWNAHKNCNDQGYHLCNFQEWYYACINNSGMVSMPQNFEWVHTSSNHNIHALKIGAASNCTNVDSETTATTGLPMYFRCCYHLR